MSTAMRASVLGTGLAFLLGAGGAEAADSGGMLTPAEKKATVEYILGHQQDSGGFSETPKAGTPATLPATVVALFAVAHYEGALTNAKGCSEFVKACSKGHFAVKPDAAPDHRMTPLGALAFFELRRLRFDFDWFTTANNLFRAGDAAQTLDEFRLFALAWRRMENEGIRLAASTDGIEKRIKALGFADGTFGKGPTAVRDTATGVIALRELGYDVLKAEAVAKLLKEAQRSDGGWGPESSELLTTFRVVHALVLLKGECDVAACRKFVAKCRQENGSYANQPGQPGNLFATSEAGATLTTLRAFGQPKK